MSLKITISPITQNKPTISASNCDFHSTNENQTYKSKACAFSALCRKSNFFLQSCNDLDLLLKEACVCVREPGGSEIMSSATSGLTTRASGNLRMKT